MRAVVATIAGLALAGTAIAQDADDPPVLLEAERIRWEAETERAVATGSVFLARGEFTLMADEVVYDRAAGTVEAIGNVVLVEPGGTASFADRMALDDRLETGFIEGIAVRLTDDSLAVARRGDRRADRTTTFRDVTYTPCEVCDERAPTWQINAATIEHDQEERVLRYENATFEIAGVPVLFTPYFQHPDPSVERQSGFLAPTLEVDTELGVGLETPYYWAIAPNRDLTLRPTVYTEENPVLALDYRDLQSFGRTEVTVSGTYTRPRSNGGPRGRGAIDARGRYDLGAEWDGGFDLNLATDDTYLRRYNISDANVLDSAAFARRTDNDHFIEVSALAYQDLRPGDDQTQVPFALPAVESTYTGEIAAIDGVWKVQPNLLGLFRTEGIDTGRASVLAEVEVPRISPYGDVFNVAATVRGDLYAVSDNADVDDGDLYWRARILPRATVDWRRPYARSAGEISYEIEPAANLTVAGTGYDRPSIPNNDSLDLEFDETNLFRANRFPGLDLWDEGIKTSYGIRTAAVGPDRELWSIFIGQSYRFSETEVFDDVSGLSDQLSDLVGRVALSPHPWIDFDQRFRVSVADGNISKNDLKLIFGPPSVRIAAGYLRVEDESGFESPVREEARAAVSVRFDDHWSLIASARRDLDAGEEIRNGVGLLYRDECLTVALGAERDFTEDGDALPSTTVALRVGFRNLGSFGGSSPLAVPDSE